MNGIRYQHLQNYCSMRMKMGSFFNPNQGRGSKWAIKTWTNYFSSSQGPFRANENWKTVWAKIPKSPVFGIESFHIQWFLSAQDIIQLWIIFKLKFLDNIILQSKSRETRLGSKVIGLFFLFDHCRSLMFLLRSLTRGGSGEWSSLPIP